MIGMLKTNEFRHLIGRKEVFRANFGKLLQLEEGWQTPLHSKLFDQRQRLRMIERPD